MAFGACQGPVSTNDGPAVNAKAPANDVRPETKPSAEPEKPTSDLKPEAVDPDKPVPAGELNVAFLADEKAWIGKEVSIIGKYHSTTGSTVAGEDRIRVDISDPETNKKAVGCIVKQNPPEEISKERENRVFKGKILENRYGRILIEPCEFVK